LGKIKLFAPTLQTSRALQILSEIKILLKILLANFKVRDYGTDSSINKDTLRTFFRVYCDLSFQNPSVLTNIPKFASAAPEK
jgi:hypothetical protein